MWTSFSSIKAYNSVSLLKSLASASVNKKTCDPLSLALIARMTAPMLGSGQSPPPEALNAAIPFKKTSMLLVVITVPGSLKKAIHYIYIYTHTYNMIQ